MHRVDTIHPLGPAADAKAVSVHAAIAEAAKTMRDHALPDLLVTDDGRLVGVIGTAELAAPALSPGGG